MRIYSNHHFRRAARKEERRIQKALDDAERDGTLRSFLFESGMPEWTRGVRVESAGLFDHAVVLTEKRGH